MPFKIKSSYKKKVYKKKTKTAVVYKKKAAVVRKNIAVLGRGLPKRMIITHKFNDFTDLFSAIGLPSTKQISCNSMYSPDGSSHQPLYHDQMMALYNHYTVVGSKITFRICAGQQVNKTIKVALFINDDTTTTPTFQTLSEQSSASNFIIPAGSNEVYTRVLKWSGKKAFGAGIISNPLFRGTAIAGPTEQQYFQVSAYDPSGNDMDVDIDYTVEYIAVWNELKDIAGS